MHTPKVYFAGKIAQNDWRHGFVPELRYAGLGEEIPGKGFVYVGPYFVGCDHGCAHGPHTHGLKKDSCAFHVAPKQEDVPARCRDWLGQADLFFAWIDAPTAYGTLVEAGWAQEAGIPAYLAFSSRALMREMWFAGHGPSTAAAIHAHPTRGLQAALAFYLGFSMGQVRRRRAAGTLPWLKQRQKDNIAS